MFLRRSGAEAPRLLGGGEPQACSEMVSKWPLKIQTLSRNCAFLIPNHTLYIIIYIYSYEAPKAPERRRRRRQSFVTYKYSRSSRIQQKLATASRSPSSEQKPPNTAEAPAASRSPLIEGSRFPNGEYGITKWIKQMNKRLAEYCGKLLICVWKIRMFAETNAEFCGKIRNVAELCRKK